MCWVQDREVCILKLLESNWSAYATCWIKCDVDRRRSIRGKYYRTCNGRKGLRKGKGGTCSQNHYSSNVTTASATTNELSSRTQRWSEAVSLESCSLRYNNREWLSCHNRNNGNISWTYYYVNFAEMNRGRNTTLYFLWQYMQMMRVRLLFIRVQREGIWDLHLYWFEQILPYFCHRYYHTNNTRRGVIYLAQINQLPVEVLQQFQQGNCVVMGSEGRFNQVDPDHSHEWLDGIRKRPGGIVGITQKNILNHSVDALFLTMYGLRLQPQQGRCLHLSLMTTWLAMNRPN